MFSPFQSQNSLFDPHVICLFNFKLDQSKIFKYGRILKNSLSMHSHKQEDHDGPISLTWVLSSTRLLKFNFSISISRADNTDWSGMTWPIIKPIQDLMLIFIVTKFGADWFIFVDVRE